MVREFVISELASSTQIYFFSWFENYYFGSYFSNQKYFSRGSRKYKFRSLKILISRGSSIKLNVDLKIIEKTFLAVRENRSLAHY